MKRMFLPILSLAVFLFFLGWLINDVIVGVSRFYDDGRVARTNDSLYAREQKMLKSDTSAVGDSILQVSINDAFAAYSTITTENLKPLDVKYAQDKKILFSGIDGKENKIELLISTKAFIPFLHAFTYTEVSADEDYERELLFIDGELIYGNIASTPNTMLDKFEFYINGEKKKVGKQNYMSFYNPKLVSPDGKRKFINAYLVEGTEKLIVVINNTESKSPYRAALIFEDYKFVDRYVSFGVN